MFTNRLDGASRSAASFPSMLTEPDMTPETLKHLETSLENVAEMTVQSFAIDLLQHEDRERAIRLFCWLLRNKAAFSYIAGVHRMSRAIG